MRRLPIVGASICTRWSRRVAASSAVALQRRDMFKGVRYAAPPFGANRLRPPQPVEPWDEVYDALAFGPKSPQVAYSPGIAEGIPERSAKARTA